MKEARSGSNCSPMLGNESKRSEGTGCHCPIQRHLFNDPKFPSRPHLLKVALPPFHSTTLGQLGGHSRSKLWPTLKDTGVKW